VAEARDGEAVEVDRHATRHTRVVQSHLKVAHGFVVLLRGFDMKKYEGNGVVQ
jgi:hypothetical protein